MFTSTLSRQSWYLRPGSYAHHTFKRWCLQGKPALLLGVAAAAVVACVFAVQIYGLRCLADHDGAALETLSVTAPKASILRDIGASSLPCMCVENYVNMMAARTIRLVPIAADRNPCTRPKTPQPQKVEQQADAEVLRTASNNPKLQETEKEDSAQQPATLPAAIDNVVVELESFPSVSFDWHTEQDEHGHISALVVQYVIPFQSAKNPLPRVRSRLETSDESLQIEKLQAAMVFSLGGVPHALNLTELSTAYYDTAPYCPVSAPTLGGDMMRRAYAKAKTQPVHILDIGGRARSGLSPSSKHPHLKITVLDILPGPAVDVVGDAHKLSDYFPAQHFDFVIASSVFEHLAMPWKVVLEMNKVLKNGGEAFITTHQTVGMHDLPWDFWRFSEFTWPTLFNYKTGFKVVSTDVGRLVFVVPFRTDVYFTRNRYLRSSGAYRSNVLVQKVGAIGDGMQWDVPTSVVSGMYPAGEVSDPKRRAWFLDDVAESIDTAAMYRAEHTDAQDT